MASEWLLYISSAVIVLWGIAHIAPTASVVNGFGPISEENKRIITMEWVAEGLTLCFTGLLVVLVTALAGPRAPASTIVYRVCGSILIVLAGWTLLTGARTSIMPMKVCPLVKTGVAIMFFLGSAL